MRYPGRDFDALTGSEFNASPIDFQDSLTVQNEEELSRL
jgi:hypothetical protein